MMAVSCSLSKRFQRSDPPKLVCDRNRNDVVHSCATWRTAQQLSALKYRLRGKPPPEPEQHIEEETQEPSPVVVRVEERPPIVWERRPVVTVSKAPKVRKVKKEPEKPPEEEPEVEPERSPSSLLAMRVWEAEMRFLERRGIKVMFPTTAISPIAAARAAMKKPPKPHLSGIPKSSSRKIARVRPTTTRGPSTMARSKDHSNAVCKEKRCGPGSLCHYLGSHFLYKPLTLALLQLYKDRPSPPEALRTLAKFLDDQHVTAERLKELRKEVEESDKTLKRLKQDNDEFKKKIGELKELRKTRSKKR